MLKNILLLTGCLLLFTTCKKQEDFLFEMNYDLEFTIQPGLSPFGGIYGYKIKDIPSNFDNYLSANGRNADDITNIACGSARATALFTGAEYGFIRNATVIIASSTDTAFFKPAFERIQVPDDTGSQLDLIGTLVDAAPILQEETFEVWFEMELRQTSPSLINSRLELTFLAQGE